MIKVKDITPENFAKFGRVVKWPTTKPTAEAKEFKFWSDITDYHIAGETEIGVCTVFQQAKMEVSGVERHFRTPEILIPIDAPFILPVLLDGEPDSALETFRVNLGEAVVIGDAVWHGACLPVGKTESSYFVIFRKGTPFEDVEKKSISKIEVEL
jgi:ureidoglycolate hydrolase